MSKQSRRKFISKLGASIGSTILIPVAGIATQLKHIEEMEEKKPIKNIREMGFQWDTADPFLFCVHHEDNFPKGNAEMGPATGIEGRPLGDDFIIKDGYRMYHGQVVPGFPGHPHRGFETITVVREGIVDHADSLGAAGRYGNGDVQWMTAGKGVQHSEMFPLISEEKPNPMELFQIWLNLPKKNKMVNAHFKMLWADSIPKYTHENDGKKTMVEVIAGSIEDKKAPAPPPNSWAADPLNEVAVWNIKMDAGAKWELPKTTEGINRTIYFYQGDAIIIGGEKVPTYHAADLIAHMDVKIENTGTQEARLLILQGKPINEPVIQYGPFVMNTKEEIKQAFEDYHETQFGGWPWPRYDQVHDRKKGRFAKHADGVIEEKG